MLKAISSEAATQVVGGHEGHGLKVDVGIRLTAGVGTSGPAVTVGPSVGIGGSIAVHRPKSDWTPKIVSPGQRKQTDHANEIQGPTGRQRSK